jgi:hypothetical protein
MHALICFTASTSNMNTYVITHAYTTGEWTFPECPVLPQVSKIGHSGKKNTRGRETLGEDSLPRVQHSGKRCTRRRKLVLNGGNRRSYVKNILPRVLCPSTRGSKPLPRVPHPSTRGSKPSPSARGSKPSPSARGRHSGKNFSFFSFFTNFFVRPPHIILNFLFKIEVL